MKLWIIAEAVKPAEMADQYLCYRAQNDEILYEALPSEEIISRKYDFLFYHPRDYFEFFSFYSGGIYTASVFEDKDERKQQTDVEANYKKLLHVIQKLPVRNFNEINKRLPQHLEDMQQKSEEELDELDDSERAEVDQRLVVTSLRDMPKIDVSTNLIWQLFQAISEPTEGDQELLKKLNVSGSPLTISNR